MDHIRNKTKVMIPVMLVVTICMSLLFVSCSRQRDPSEPDSGQASSNTNASVSSTKPPSKPQFNEKYTADVNELVYATIETINQNYESFRLIYADCNLPSTEEYLNRFIEAINKMDALVIVDKLNPDDPNLDKLDDAKGKYYLAVYGEIYIAKDAMEVMVETLIHEYTHYTQKSIIEGLAYMDPALDKVFTEGEACFYALMASTVVHTSNHMIRAEDLSFAFGGDGADKYAMYSNFFHKLMTILGYQTIETVKTKYNLDMLSKAISSYGVDGETFMVDIALACTYPDEEQSIEYGMEIENLYLQILRQKMQKISTKQEAENLFVLYQYAKRQFKCTVFRNDGEFDFTNVSDQYLDYSSTNETLLEMIRKYQLLPAQYDQMLMDVLLNNTIEEQSLRHTFYAVDNDSVVYVKMDHAYGILAFHGEDVQYADQTPNIEFRRAV